MKVDKYYLFSTSSEMTVCEYDDYIDIIFPGSSGWQDWTQNLNFFAWPCKPYHNMSEIWFAHRGHFKKWKACLKEWREIFLELIEQSLVHKKNIYILGYSQGHAMAVFLHEWITFNFPKTIPYLHTHTFGGAKEFLWIGPQLKERLHNIVQYVYENDIVTKIPFGYCNGGNTIIIGKRTPIILSVKDHYKINYISRMSIWLYKDQLKYFDISCKEDFK